MNIWENLQIYKHKTQNKLIPEQIQINTKHDTIFKELNIENTQNTNTYTTVSYTHLLIGDTYCLSHYCELHNRKLKKLLYMSA